MTLSSGGDLETDPPGASGRSAPARWAVRGRQILPVLLLGYLGLHSAVVLGMRCAGLVSNILIALAAFSAAAASLWRRTQCPGTDGGRWTLIGLGLASWTVGQALLTYSECVQHTRASSALTSDFYFFVYGVSLLFVVSSPHENYQSMMFLVIDTCQAVFAVGLSYVVLFNVLPSGINPHPLSAIHVMQIYNVENVALAAAATLRLLARPLGEERNVFRILTVFLWVYAAIAFPLNYASAVWQQPSGSLADVFWDIPFLIIVFASIWARFPEPVQAPPGEGNTAALVAHNGSPIFFTLAALAMGAFIEHRQPVLGMAAIGISLLLYGTRATLLQSRFMRTEAALSRSQQALREANDRLQRLSISDPLTGVANRRQFEHTLAVEWKRAGRTRSPLSILMIDVDHFKALNDRYGHLRGDDCLVQIASILREKLRRGGELLARYGGEEFVAILPNVDLEAAGLIAERLRAGVADLHLPNEGSRAGGEVTASVGVGTAFPASGGSPRELVAAADAALYHAKCNGRNRVELVTLPWRTVSEEQAVPEPA